MPAFRSSQLLLRVAVILLLAAICVQAAPSGVGAQAPTNRVLLPLIATPARSPTGEVLSNDPFSISEGAADPLCVDNGNPDAFLLCDNVVYDR